MDKTDSEKNVQYGRSGHRQRMRESYLASGTEHMADHAAQIILAHNHPWGKADFSANDINFTLSVRDIMRTLGINLIDHIVVGDENTVSMRSHKTYKNYF